MTRRCVTDEQFGWLTRRADELKRRVDEGTLSFDQTMDQLQVIIESTRKFFTFPVDFDDPCWKMFPFQGNYAGVDTRLKLEHFPVRYSGKANVTVELVKSEFATTPEKHLVSCQQQGALEIDRAISETFFEKFPLSIPRSIDESCIYAPCGIVVPGGIFKLLACIYADSLGICLSLTNIEGRLNPGTNFLVLRKIEPLVA